MPWQRSVQTFGWILTMSLYFIPRHENMTNDDTNKNNKN